MGHNARERARRKAEAKALRSGVHRAPRLHSDVLLITWGIPGVGKTTFANWLVTEKRFTRIDSDYPNPASQLDQLWRAVGRGMTPEDFVVEARRQGPVVLEYGMYANPGGIAMVRRIAQAGALAWWFDGDRDEAFNAWRRDAAARGMAVDKWEEVVQVIRKNWPMVEEFFGEHMVRTIEAGPVHVPPDDTYRAIFGEGG